MDSDILIEVSRGRDREIARHWIALSDADAIVSYSPVSAAELWAGARAEEHSTLEELFRALNCVPIDARIGARAGGYIRLFRKSHAVELADALIAASAQEIGAKLWTRNRKHYPMAEIGFF